MIEQLTIEGYRGFEKLSMEGLGRVNLIVGKNNAGKTSVLEAVRLLAGSRDVMTMREIARVRGEVVVDESSDRSRSSTNLAHAFHGHEVRAGQEINIRSAQRIPPFNLVVQAVEEILERDADARIYGSGGVVDDHRDLAVDPSELAISFMPEVADDVQAYTKHFAMDAAGLLLIDRHPMFRSRYQRLSQLEQVALVRVLPPESLGAEEMATMWSEMRRRKEQRPAIEALRVLDPMVRDVEFLAGSTTRSSSTQGIYLDREDEALLTPIGSMGDGMRRMLALSLALASARGGYLLVDEIDTGLHWSVMADMWKLVMQAAKDNGVQVFATTHSKDCLEALAEAVEGAETGLFEDPNDRPVVFRVEAGRDTAARFDADMLRYAVEEEIEVRG